MKYTLKLPSALWDEAILGLKVDPQVRKRKLLKRVSFFKIYVDQIIHAIENFAGGASRIPAGENQRMMEGRQRRNQHRNRNFTFISGMKDLKNIIATSLERLKVTRQ